MSRVTLPHDAEAGPTRPEVRAVTTGKLRSDRTDHLAEIGSRAGAGYERSCVYGDRPDRGDDPAEDAAEESTDEPTSEAD